MNSRVDRVIILGYQFGSLGAIVRVRWFRLVEPNRHPSETFSLGQRRNLSRVQDQVKCIIIINTGRDYSSNASS